MERSIALQKVAKRLKDDNQILREENRALKARVTELEARIEFDTQIMSDSLSATDKKRCRDLFPPAESHTPFPHVSKRTRDSYTVNHPRHNSFSADIMPSFLSSLECATDSTNATNHSLYVPRQETGFSTSGNLSSKLDHDEPDPLPSFITCGLCESGTLCLCRGIACPIPMEQSVDSTTANTSAEQNNFVTALSSDKRNESKILDKSPLLEPAVPIRRRNRGVLPNSIFPVYKVLPSEYAPQATCSGDPDNCLACAGDTFGQAFCAAIGTSSLNCVCSPEVMSGCCGSSSRCSDCPSIISSLNPGIPEQVEMMPTNDAWQKLKTHPNVQFADLTLLAEVVSRKSVCNGPQLISSADSHKSQTDCRTDADVRDPPPPRLVPHDVLLECGRKRMRQVRTDGLREALRLLDAKF